MIGAAWVLSLAAAGAPPADWPTWRADAGRTGIVAAEALPAAPHLEWVRHLPPPRPAWRDEAGMQFYRGYLPVAAGGLLFVGSTVNDRVTAYDLATGAERWRFYTGGPVRTAPAVSGGRVYVGSDDGLLYCLRAADGGRLWAVRGGVRDRRLVGNERVISTWPVRGGPVVAPDPSTGRPAVYFAAGLWPFMGVFVHAVDAETGRAIWANDAASFTWRRMPHPGAASFNGLSPQGHLAIVGEKLIVPGSAHTPAVFDRATGRLRFFGEGGGPRVCGRGRFAFAGGGIFEANTGYPVRWPELRRPGLSVMAEKVWYTREGVFDPASAEVREKTVQVPETTDPDGPTYPKQVFEGTIRRVGGEKRVRLGTPWLLAGSRLVTTGRVGKARATKGHTSVQIVNVAGDLAPPDVPWQASVPGEVACVLAAEARLVVVTEQGAIHCFGGRAGEVRTHGLPAAKAPAPTAWADHARQALSACGTRAGYALVLGLKDGGLAEELARGGTLHVVAVDADAGRVDALRRRLDAAGQYGRRAAAIQADPAEVDFAPYLASLIVSEDPSRAGPAGRLFDVLRPYGGALCLAREIDANGLDGAAVARRGRLTVLRRPGAPAGAADWLGQNADAGNTRCSRDERVRAPLGVLWFGNAVSNSLVLPRHGEGPVEQVARGRMFIEGPDSLSAADIYTGRLLWSRAFAGLGKYFDQTKHQRGAHAVGSNFFAAPDAVYVAAGEACEVLDPATGRTVRQLRMPPAPGETKPSPWLFVLVYEDLLIAGAEPIVTASGSRLRYNTPASSRRLVVLDRRTGTLRWQRPARGSFRHYAIVAGRGKVFCIDRASPEQEEQLARRGERPTLVPRIYALDARTGRVVWQTERCAGRALSYSAEHDVLLADGALRGETGEVVWAARTPPAGEEVDPAFGPAVRVGLQATADHLWWGKWGPVLRGRTIYTQQKRAFDLRTGELKTWRDAAGRERAWGFPRSHGCGPMAGSRHVLTFRSGCAGFFDLARDGGTGNLGGFRSGCTSNLIAAGGVLSAPDYTRTCGCSYQNRSSLGLVHMPEAELWTFGPIPSPGRVGYNFGAPGDRRADDGVLWRAAANAAEMHYKRPARVAVAPGSAEAYYRHASRIVGGAGLKWVVASGVVGLRSAALPLDEVLRDKPIRLRLYFAEPTHTEPGRRVFGIALNGKPLVTDLDVAREAGGRFRGLVKDCGLVRPDGSAALTLTFTPKTGRALLCGAELVQE